MMSPPHRSVSMREAAWKACRAAAVAALAPLLLAGCCYPGAIASSNVPIAEQYVELDGGAEEFSSCGYSLLIIPISNPKPVATLMKEAIGSKGGDAMIQVSSRSTTSLFTRCVYIKGKVIRFVQADVAPRPMQFPEKGR